MKTITLSKQEYKGESRLTLRFSYDAELNRLIRGIIGIQWSIEMHCYHAVFSQSTVNNVISLLQGKAEIDISQIETTGDLGKVEISIEKSKDNGRQKQIIEEASDDEDFFIDSKPWEAKEMSNSNGLGAVKFSIDRADGRLTIKFMGHYEADWIRELKSYGKATYDSKNRVWLLTWSQIAVDSLADYFGLRGVKVIVEKVTVPEIVKDQRVIQGQEIRDRVLNENVVKGLEKVKGSLMERRYSKHTIEAYLSLLEVFFKYYNHKNPLVITQDDITIFFKEYVAFHKYSASYQNQLVSAIKVYYAVNGHMQIAMGSISRPRRVRALPKVFSKEEVQSILNAGYNLKHKLILWMIYSCGLRRSEVINIKLTDFERDRGILNIREAKGMVDRIVPVSARVWSKIDEYLEAYKPKIWLFEGAKGSKYSVESVYRVFKAALKKTGINKEVGVHSLRHSYATHLHESGLDIRYIQELLGHKSTRTTEIYTHVSRRDLIMIKSPIEDLDLK